MSGQKKTNVLKHAWNKVAHNKVGKWVTAWLLPIYTNLTLPQYLTLFIGTLGVHAMAASLLPTLEDKAAEYKIDSAAIDTLQPYGKVVIRDHSFLSQLHSATKYPGLIGVINHLYWKHAAGAYAMRSTTPLDRIFSDRSLQKIGSRTILDISKVSSFLETNAGKNQNSEKLKNKTAQAYMIFFHEVRHASKDHQSHTHAEMDANYYAEKAMEIQFERDFGSDLDSKWFGNKTYDYALYKEFKDLGRPIPGRKQLEKANEHAFEIAYNKILKPVEAQYDSKQRSAKPTPESRQPAGSKPQNAPASSDLTMHDFIGETIDFSANIKMEEGSDLMKRRFAHFIYRSIFGFRDGIDYQLNDDLSATIIQTETPSAKLPSHTVSPPNAKPGV